MDVVTGITGIVLLLVVYFLPAIVAMARNHPGQWGH